MIKIISTLDKKNEESNLSPVYKRRAVILGSILKNVTNMIIMIVYDYVIMYIERMYEPCYPNKEKV